MADPGVQVAENPQESRPAILIVDDREDNRLALTATLDDLGAEFVEASSGEEAIAILQQSKFAVVLLDVNLPGVSGFETARQIRAREELGRAPIIFVTATDVDSAELERGYSLGAIDFLVKPIMPAILRAKVRGFIESFEEKQRAARDAEQIRLLVHGTVDYAIFMLDSTGHVLSWNLGAQRLKGYTADEIIGQHFSRFYPAAANEKRWPQHELDVAGREGRFEDEGWRVRKDGSQFWANVVITALRDESGQLRGFSKVTRDLTARRASEEALRRSEERFRMLVDGVHDYAIFLLAPSGNVLTWNAGAERIKGYRADEIIGQHFSRFYPQEAIDRAWPAHELTAAQSAGRFEDEGWRVRKDGTQFWANVVITALFDDAGRLQGFAKITRDMTERRQAEENQLRLLEETAARREAERNAHIVQGQRERLQVTLASIADAVISTDARGRVEFLNPVAELLVGWKTGEAVGQSVVDVFRIVDQQTRQPLENPALKALALGTAVDLANHAVLISKQGTERPIDDTAAPIRDAKGAVVGSVLVFRDISPLKLANEALRHADQRKDEFLATLAHELRNPLAPIRNSLQLLKMPRLDAEVARQSRDVMERQVHHLVRLVDDLLDVSRVMRGKIDLRPERIEVASVVANALESAQSLIDVQGHRLDVSIAEDSLLLEADPVRLAQVIGNLLTNAAKYSEPQGRIWLTAQRFGGDVVIKVRDSGIGIAPDMLPHVFELFVQADHATSKAQGGLGIGLTLVKSLVEMHHGSVTAHSAGLGKGSEFVVRLPLVSSAREAEAPAQSQTEPAAAPAAHRVVVVDDNKDAALSLTLLLRALGYDVKTAYDGAAALETAAQFRPHAMFLDIGMPGIDGYEVARRIKSTSALDGILLTALTGWGQEEDRRRTAEAGFDHHVVKPPDLARIKEILASLAETS